MVGTIDCTHVPIAAPWKHAEQYVNRNGIFSINTQVVVNHREAIAHLSVRWPGSVHDLRILQESYLQDVLNERLLGSYFLIGDGSY